MIEMSQWPPPAGFSLLVLMTASCGLVAPIEPLPNADVGAGASAGASAGSGDGGTAGLGGAGSGIGGGGKGAAGGGGKGGSTAGRGGQAGNNGGQSGTATAGAGALGGAGQSGFGGSAAGAGNAGSDGTCEPEFEADITDQYDAEAPLPIVVPGSQLPTLLSRVDPIVVPLDGDRYRVFALSTGSEFVYADIPHSPSEPAPVEWTRIGTGQDYFSSPPAVAVFDGPGLTSDRMWVFGVGPDRLLRYAMQEGPFDGAWVPGGSEMELTDDGLFASAKATGRAMAGFSIPSGRVEFLTRGHRNGQWYARGGHGEGRDHSLCGRNAGTRFHLDRSGFRLDRARGGVLQIRAYSRFWHNVHRCIRAWHRRRTLLATPRRIGRLDQTLASGCVEPARD
jgi:hypothetical protein